MTVSGQVLIHLTDHLYQKRLILEEYFLRGKQGDTSAELKAIAKHNAAIDSLVKDLEATYLVEIESKVLHDFKEELLEYIAK